MSVITPSNAAAARARAKDGSPRFTDALANPDVGVAAALAGAATLHALAGKITSESLTKAQNEIYTLTITNDLVAAGDLVFASVGDGTNTQGSPMVVRAKASDGQIVVTVQNKHASSEALNGTIEVSFLVKKA